MDGAAGLFSALDTTWVCVHEQFTAMLNAGFTEDQAIKIIAGIVRSNNGG